MMIEQLMSWLVKTNQCIILDIILQEQEIFKAYY